MRNQTSLHISEPCHEDWNQMTKTQQGKFCSACNKQVIDFSSMTDQQILTFLSNQSSRLCGRFHESQLDRELAETKVKKTKSVWLAYTLPFALLFQKSFAQKNTIHTTGTAAHVVIKKSTVEEMITGKMAVCQPVKKTISGRITDDKNIPIPNATILVKGTNQFTISDSLGKFSIHVDKEDSITLITSYIGYETEEKQIRITDNNEARITDNNEAISIIMQLQPAMLGEVVVVGYPTRRKTDLSGGVSVCRSITKTEKIDSALRKVLKISSFNLYPNPATKGSQIHFNIKQAGNYELQLLDNNSNLIRTHEASGQTDNAAISFLIPETISSGTYYIRLINLDKKKSSVEKLVVQ